MKHLSDCEATGQWSADDVVRGVDWTLYKSAWSADFKKLDEQTP